MISAALIQPTHRHLTGARPTRTLCGGSIAWVNVTTKPGLATCPQCIRLSMVYA